MTPLRFYKIKTDVLRGQDTKVVDTQTSDRLPSVCRVLSPTTQTEVPSRHRENVGHNVARLTSAPRPGHELSPYEKHGDSQKKAVHTDTLCVGREGREKDTTRRPLGHGPYPRPDRPGPPPYIDLRSRRAQVGGEVVPRAPPRGPAPLLFRGDRRELEQDEYRAS